ncbi:condensation domain-containing protein [Streptomyces sp. NPDC059639]|uniref:condensation domain-containing protein n=1 Tax=Streptomyces sp. NPDC059639 TaxID=3346891 RepID=UPI0036AB2D08
MTATPGVAGALTAVLALGSTTRQALVTLELRGPLDPSLLDAALASIAADRPELRDVRPRTVRLGPGHHVLELGASYPVGVLADLLVAAPGAEPPEPLALTPRQRELVADASHRLHQQVGQLFWCWHGPLDTARFSAAWQSVFDHETALRAAFVWDPEPRLALHARARANVVHHPHGALTRQALMERERARGFDPSRPGLLRVALLDGEPRPEPVSAPPSTDIVLTYHQGLLDSWSVGLLAREFYRCYLAAGRPRGGERRPDLRDYRRWLDTQDPAPARDFWVRTGGGAGAGLPRARPGAVTGRHGTFMARARLTRAEAVRLADWAARWGVTESSVLQAAWAMLLFRAAGTKGRGPAQVRFSVASSGRGIPMEGIAYLPGPFDNPLPMTLRVDPAGTVPALLRSVRDQALDMAAHEWVSAGQIGQWLGHDADAGLPDTLVSFEHRPSHLADPGPQRASHGIRMTDIDPVSGWPAFAIGVGARHDSTGGLVLTAVHDRGRLRDDHSRVMLAHSAQLLRELPYRAGQWTTVAEVLASLADTDVPRLHDHLEDRTGQALVRLRGAKRPGAGTVCLIAPPGTPATSHAALAWCYEGPEALIVLRMDPARTPQALKALRPLLVAGGRLVLGGFAGAGALAYELAGHLAMHIGEAPLVVLGARGDDCVRELARALGAAAGGP